MAVAIGAQVPHLPAAEIPGLVADTIRRCAAEDRWTPARITIVMRGRIAPPKTVTIPATKPTMAQHARVEERSKGNSYVLRHRADVAARHQFPRKRRRPWGTAAGNWGNGIVARNEPPGAK